MLEEKVKSVFSDMVVLKDPKRSEFFSNLSMPSYMRDWLVMKFSDNQGKIDYDSTLEYIKKFIPDRDAFQVIKYRLMQGSTEKLLARVRLDVNLNLIAQHSTKCGRTCSKTTGTHHNPMGSQKSPRRPLKRPESALLGASMLTRTKYSLRPAELKATTRL